MGFCISSRAYLQPWLLQLLVPRSFHLSPASPALRSPAHLLGDPDTDLTHPLPAWHFIIPSGVVVPWLTGDGMQRKIPFGHRLSILPALRKVQKDLLHLKRSRLAPLRKERPNCRVQTLPVFSSRLWLLCIPPMPAAHVVTHPSPWEMGH